MQDVYEDSTKTVLMDGMKTEGLTMFLDGMTQYGKDTNYCKIILKIQWNIKFNIHKKTK